MIVECLAALATADPGRPSVTGADGRQLTRHEVWDLARRARSTLAGGDARRKVVAMVDDTAASLSGLFGALDSGRRLVVVAADGGPSGHAAGLGGGDVDVMMFAPVWPQSNRAPAAQAASADPPSWQTPAGLLSGARRLAEMLRIGPCDRIVLTAPVPQLYGITGGLAAVLGGSALTLLPAPTPARIAEALVGASVVLGTPGTYRVVDELVQKAGRTVPLRLALYGGGPDPSGLVISDGPAPPGDCPGGGVAGLVVLQELVRRVVEVGGVKVALPWVESALRKCPGVRDAGVVDWTRPDGPRSLRGFVVVDAHVSGHDVVQFCHGWGLAAHEVPWIIEEVDWIPRTAGGDVDVRALAEPSRWSPPTSAILERTGST